MNFKIVAKSSIIYLVLIILYSFGLNGVPVSEYIFSIYEHLCIILALFPIIFIEVSSYYKYHTYSRKAYLDGVVKQYLSYTILFWVSVVFIKLIIMLINDTTINFVIYGLYSVVLLYELIAIILLMSIISILPNKKTREICKYTYVCLMIILLFTESKYSLILTPILIACKFFELSYIWFIISLLSTLILVLILNIMINKGDYND